MQWPSICQGCADRNVFRGLEQALAYAEDTADTGAYGFAYPIAAWL
jgi:TPP-dependent indolepyruvate ferredoxin oxidoreductase alpha subunit